MQPLDLATAEMLLDFSGGDPQLKELGRLQLEGAVALQNMLANPDIGMGYLADEVGMGKTYIALGVVALMRYFNPGFRVLYICPSRNVQEKWHGREHPNFIKKNVRTCNYKIRTPQGDPGTPSISCSTIEELIHAVTTGYYGDIFVRMSSFSMAMGEDEAELERQFEALKEHVPASVLGQQRWAKADIKQAYAKALNYLLPVFDLVVIDEAHNFKHPFASSARNLALSRILGFNQDDKYGYRNRVRTALLLSATPFDMNPVHLYNQLNLVGKAHLMPPMDEWDDKGRLRQSMSRFMVRRLNELRIQSVPHTRNMYRREWRKGKRAEIEFASDEHKLILALVQKHVGDLLNLEGGNPAFQLGLLASFESYMQTTRSGPVEFDGEKAANVESDARDRHLIAAIRDSYVAEEFGKSLPHPKMDQVCRDAASLALEKGRKQLIFVRRVKSVGEIKQKLDDQYDEWLRRHVSTRLAGYSDQLAFLECVWEVYKEVRKSRDEDITGGEAGAGSEDEHLPAKNDTIFKWFFRGGRPAELEQAMPREFRRWPEPEALKKSLIAKNNANILLFEFNWAAWVAETLYGVSLDIALERAGEQKVNEVLESSVPVARDDTLSLFLSTQVAFLKAWAADSPHRAGLEELADYLLPQIRHGDYRLGDRQATRQMLLSKTFFCHLRETGLAAHFFSTPESLAAALRDGQTALHDAIHRVEIHRQLVAQSFRTGHPGIDLYLARLILGETELSESRRQDLLRLLCGMLDEQRGFDAFSSATELRLLNDNLELVIKNNLAGVYARSPDELRVWLNRQIPSSAPIIGANGETTANRSVQARKFRMPGYPLILVSTDVFQEGEDLHTFCDSVIHYGLSSSPVGIEQKIGRVDRVGAFAHRRLLGLEESKEVSDDDYIQVRFPFVKQSIEAIQVRTLCNNLNIFLGSLHEVGGNGASIEEFVDSSWELVNRNEIPEQLKEYLKSPYVPAVSRKSNPILQERVRQDSRNYGEVVRHIETILSTVASGGVTSRSGLLRVGETEDATTFDVRIDSARSCGEVLLRVTAHGQFESIRAAELTTGFIRERQAALYTEAPYRTYCIRVKDGYGLFRDAEMLVGGAGVTCHEDVAGLFRRFTSQGLGKVVPIDNWSFEFTDGRVADYLAANLHWVGAFSSKKYVQRVELTFGFNADRQRKHVIRVSRRGEHCLFEAMVADESMVRKFSRDKLLRLTWLRNRNIDLVEFLVRPDGCLAGRALHPAGSMGFEEFVFTAYVLAVEADRMEYMIKEPDEF